jgi:hypothetical protein
MIPRAYPQVPLRTKLAIAPYVLLLVVILGVLEDRGVLELAPSPSTTTTRPTAAGAAPGLAARAEIPPAYLAAYRRAARSCPGLSWALLAAVGKVESNHGRGWPPRWRHTPGIARGTENFAGAAGPMQFGIGVGRAGNAWATYGRDDDGDGRTSVYDPGDAIPAAARYLCAAGAPDRLDQAIYAYNHSWVYVARAKAIARRYARGDGRR